MFSTISRKRALNLYPWLPQWDGEKETLIYPHVLEQFIITLHSKTIKGHISNVAAKLHKVFKQMGCDDMILLGESEQPYLKQENDYKYAKEAFDHLREREIGRKFNGAILASDNELLSTLKHIAWLSRCNAAFPIVYITDKQQTALWNICQYGNVHVDVLNETALPLIRHTLKQNKFELIDKC